MNDNGTNGNGWTNWTLAQARPRMDRFLDKLRNSGNVRASCHASDIPRSTAYYWRNKFAWFRNAWDDAMEDACDILEGVAWQRAVDESSDRLLMFLLKAHRPERFKERSETDIVSKGEQLQASVVVYVPDNGRNPEQ